MGNKYAVNRKTNPNRPKMSRENRAKQFAPFKTLWHSRVTLT